ncbi:MAG: anhydro-N-acetylmuramic acid kinase [Caldilineaceae bacterium]|nr:anhydro-N-acetylmuramic acid kinase [Caldilineaceae bacterium]
MSGTSVDGIDVAIADIEGAPNQATLRVQQLAFQTIPWDATIRQSIFTFFAQAMPAAAFCRLNFTLATAFATAVKQVLTSAQLPLNTIDLIGSHGQTLWHDVVEGEVTSTLQLGDPSVIAVQTGKTTIGNFRVADVAAGGQGAPLVSTFDWYLLRPPASLNGVVGGWRAVQNIGGIGNVTFLPPQGSPQPPLAFDTGPGNALIDWAAHRATNGQQEYDHDGLLAQQGKISSTLVARWLALPYFRQQPPKTTGRELFSATLAETWWSEAMNAGLSAVDFVATITEVTATSIAEAYHQFAPGPLAQVVIGGGGARNPYLIQRLRHHLQPPGERAIDLCTHATLGIDDKAKEALAFALLAYLALHGWPGNVPACTGATSNQILGQIAPGANYTSLVQRAQASLLG